MLQLTVFDDAYTGERVTNGKVFPTLDKPGLSAAQRRAIMRNVRHSITVHNLLDDLVLFEPDNLTFVGFASYSVLERRHIRLF